MAKELLDVVDENNELLGIQADRYEIIENADKGWWRRTVHAIIINDEGKILSAWRSSTKKIGPRLFCNASAGQVDAGESYADAMIREIKEELGVDIPVNSMGSFKWNDGHTHVEMYLAKHNGPFTNWEEEAEALEWFTLEELNSLSKRLPYLFTDGFMASVDLYKEYNKNNPEI
jgi:16S rRNA (adenine1518-N6/adenine1519-N6)-dimethyltransferase